MVIFPYSSGWSGTPKSKLSFYLKLLNVDFTGMCYHFQLGVLGYLFVAVIKYPDRRKFQKKGVLAYISGGIQSTMLENAWLGGHPASILRKQKRMNASEGQLVKPQGLLPVTHFLQSCSLS